MKLHIKVEFKAQQQQKKALFVKMEAGERYLKRHVKTVSCALVCVALPLVPPLVLQRGCWEMETEEHSCHSFTLLPLNAD